MSYLIKIIGFKIPPNSPDLAYPIETLWGILKARIKRRMPKKIDELKLFIQEEWASVPKLLLKNMCDRYIAKLKKVIKLVS